MYLTQCMIRRLSTHPSMNRVSGALALFAVTSFPLLVSSWFVSVDRFSKDNIPAHETMQAVYPWNVLMDICEYWTDTLYHWLWFTDDETDSNPGTATPGT